MSGQGGTMTDFNGVHCSRAVNLHAVFFHIRNAISCRDLEEILAERGVAVEPTMLNRWVVKFAPLIAATAQTRKRATAKS